MVVDSFYTLDWEVNIFTLWSLMIKSHFSASKNPEKSNLTFPNHNDLFACLFFTYLRSHQKNSSYNQQQRACFWLYMAENYSHHCCLCSQSSNMSLLQNYSFEHWVITVIIFIWRKGSITVFQTSSKVCFRFCKRKSWEKWQISRPSWSLLWIGISVYSYLNRSLQERLSWDFQNGCFTVT